MIRCRGKDGGQVKCIDPKLLKVIQVLYHPIQISTLKTKRGGRGMPGFQVQPLALHPFTFCKAVWENLVKHSIAYPVGEFKIHKKLPFVTKIH
ncbi:hypothetical protein SDC9_212215 [bioreactor metagenome]|uniref:Uncharacterized protein n=1 Tax=bioreactor metagenome TaxID=1076179 RepID=A0A645JZN5_9ZZZZ